MEMMLRGPQISIRILLLEFETLYIPQPCIYYYKVSVVGSVHLHG